MSDSAHPAGLLVRPGPEYLPGFVAALRRGWSPDNIRGAAAVPGFLERIERDAAGFLASLEDREARGEPIRLPDGTVFPRLPSFARWIWDGEFCGAIGLRWQQGTAALPPHVLGHIGYAVVPWKRRRGYATRALREILPAAKAEGLAYVELTTDADNLTSQHVIEANGGRVIERFTKAAHYGGSPSLRYRIDLL